MRYTLLIPVLLLFMVWPMHLSAHDIHISMVKIDYNEETQSLEIAVKAYTDDYELAINKSGSPVCKLNTDEELKDSEKYMLKYLKLVLLIEVNGTPVEFTMVGHEYDDMTTWTYVEAKEIPHVETVRVSYVQHMEVYDDQQNIVHVQVGGKTESTVFTKYKKSTTFSF